jgi:hypothetical protein
MRTKKFCLQSRNDFIWLGLQWKGIAFVSVNFCKRIVYKISRLFMDPRARQVRNSADAGVHRTIAKTIAGQTAGVFEQY